MSGSEFTLNVVLNCTSSDSTSEKQLIFDSTHPPATVLDVKSLIQSTFKIPVCCQTLYHGLERLGNDEGLKAHRIRDGETVKVCYSSEADVDKVLGAIAVMSEMVSFITGIQPLLTNETATPELNTRISANVKYIVVEHLIADYFFERLDERADANRMLFVDNGGLHCLAQLHDLLLKQPWHKTPLQLQCLEEGITSVYWNLSCNAVTSRLLIKESIIEAILTSFLRVKIKGIDIELSENKFADMQGSKSRQKQMAFAVVIRSLGALCNIAENPDSRMQISAKQEVLEQIVAISNLSFGNQFAICLLPISTMLNLAYSSNTHSRLATLNIMQEMIQACEIARQNFDQEDETRLLQFNCIMFLALLVISSARLIPLDFKVKICDFIEEFLTKANPLGIHESGKENEHFWTTVAPYMAPAYYPYSNPGRSCTNTTLGLSENEAMRKLELVCMEMGVFSLQTAVVDSEGMAVIEKEGLVNYIICLPWNAPKGSKARERAHELNGFLGKRLNLQPPPLLIIAKAKLAAMHFGLNRVLKVNSVHELLAEVYPV